MAKTAPSPRLEEEISQKEQENQFVIFLRQVFTKLGKQDELMTVCLTNTHAHFRSGEERSPPV